MSRVEVRVDHTLGAQGARERIEAAAAELLNKNASLVRSLEWSPTGARVEGNGFGGELVLREDHVLATVELQGLPAMFPLKAKRELEGWLQRVLGSTD